MKMKEVCRMTGLTERTVRFYVEQGLLTPETTVNNGRTYLSFTDANISELETMATLRRAQFSISEIVMMKREPGRIPEIAGLVRSQLRRQALETGELAGVLETAELGKIQDISALARILSAEKPPEPMASVLEPGFGRFDGVTRAEKDEAYRRFLINAERRTKRRRYLGAFCAAIILVFASVMITLFACGVLPAAKAAGSESEDISRMLTDQFTETEMQDRQSAIDFPIRAYPSAANSGFSFRFGGFSALNGDPVLIYSDANDTFTVQWDKLNPIECAAVDELELPILAIYGDDDTAKNRLEIIVPGESHGEYFGVWIESATLSEAQMLDICSAGIYVNCLWDGGFSGIVMPLD